VDKSKFADTYLWRTVQVLVLKILSVMSVNDESLPRLAALRIRRAFMDIRVGEKLLNLVKSDEFSRKAESMKDALILIGNLSLAGRPFPVLLQSRQIENCNRVLILRYSWRFNGLINYLL